MNNAIHLCAVKTKSQADGFTNSKPKEGSGAGKFGADQNHPCCS